MNWKVSFACYTRTVTEQCWVMHELWVKLWVMFDLAVSDFSFTVRVYNWIRLGDIVNMHIDIWTMLSYCECTNYVWYISWTISRVTISWMHIIWFKLQLHRFQCISKVRLALFNRSLCRGDLRMGVKGVVRPLVCIILTKFDLMTYLTVSLIFLLTLLHPVDA